MREPTAGKKVLGQRESMTINEYLAIVEKTKGRKAQYVAPPADYTQLPSPPFLQQSIFEMGKWWDEFGYDGREAHIVTPKEVCFCRCYHDLLGNILLTDVVNS